MNRLLNDIMQLLEDYERYEKELGAEKEKLTFHGEKYGFFQYQMLKNAEADGIDTTDMEDPTLSAGEMFLLRISRNNDIKPDMDLSELQMAERDSEILGNSKLCNEQQNRERKGDSVCR